MCWCRIGSYQLDSGIIKSDSALTVLSRSSLYKHPQSTCQLLQQLAGRSPDCTCISTNTRLIISFGGIKGPNGSLKALIYILKGLNPPAAAELCLQKLHMHCSWFLVTLCVNSFFILFSGLGTLSTEGSFFMWFFFYWNVTLNTCSQGLGPVSADVWMFICCTSGNLCRAAGGALSTWLSSHAAYRWKFPVGQLERLGAGRGGAEGTGWGRLFSWGGAVLVSDFFYLRALKQCSNNSDLWPPERQCLCGAPVCVCLWSCTGSPS